MTNNHNAATLAAAALLSLTLAVDALAQTFTDAASVRYRSLSASDGGEEVYLGSGDLGNPANRVAQELDWYLNGLPNSFAFGMVRDSQGGATMYSTALGEPLLTSSELVNSEALASANRIVITMYNRDPLGSFDIPSFRILADGVVLVEDSLFATQPVQSWLWQGQGVCFGQMNNWEVDGVIQAFGPFSNSQEASKVEISLISAGNWPENECSDALMQDGFE